MIEQSRPIQEALLVLYEQDILTAHEYGVLLGGMLSAVRTYGDLIEVIRTEDILNIPGIGDKMYQRLSKALVL